MKGIELPPKFIRAVILLSTIGLMVETYDFFSIGIISTAIWTHLFFKEATNLAITFSIIAYATILVGRLVGGIIFGHFGDKLGRKFSMFWTLIISGLAMLLIALVPPIGITAIILIATLRFIQGLGLGGDAGSSLTLGYEYAHKGEKTAYYASFIQASAILGITLGVLGVLLSERFETQTFLLNYGWRILIGVGAIAIILSAYLRKRIVESLDFKEILRNGNIEKNPIKSAFKKHGKDIILTTLSVIYFPVILNFLLYPYSLEFLVKVGYSQSLVTLVFLIASISAFIMTIIGGYLADKYGWRKVVLFSALGSLFSIPFFFINSLFALFPIYMIMSLGWGAIGVISSVFSVNVRNTSTGAVTGFIGLITAVLLITVLPTLITVYGVIGSLLPVSIITSVVITISVISTLMGGNKVEGINP